MAERIAARKRELAEKKAREVIISLLFDPWLESIMKFL
jgi:hypothetical protein